jgi:hypothetical protein
VAEEEEEEEEKVEVEKEEEPELEAETLTVEEEKETTNGNVTTVRVINISRETANCTRKKEENYGVTIVTQEATMMECVLNYIQTKCLQKADLDSIVNLKKIIKVHLILQVIKRHQLQQSM